jgi:hypothetical protein
VIIVTGGAFVAQQALKERGQDARTVSIPTKRAILTRDLQGEEASLRRGAPKIKFGDELNPFQSRTSISAKWLERVTTYVLNIASQLKCGSMEGTLRG